MQNDTLLALLLDPFVTFGEATKEYGALSAAAGRPRPEPPRPTVPSRPTAAGYRPARTTRGVPVVDHPPAISG